MRHQNTSDEAVASVNGGSIHIHEGKLADGSKWQGLRMGAGRCAYTLAAIVPTMLRKVEGPVNGLDLLLPFDVLGRFSMRVTDEAALECERALARIDRFADSRVSIDLIVESTGVSTMEYALHGDIGDLIAKYRYDLNRLEPTSVDIQRKMADGGMYGLPTWTRSMVLFYNKDLFDLFGVSYPKDGMTWDELYELARRMTRTEGGQSYKGLTMAFEFGLMLNQLGVPSQDAKSGKALFLEDGFKRAFENQARFYRIAGNGLPGDRFYLDNQQNPFYKTKTSAMFLTLSGAEKQYKDSVNWDVAAFPVFPGKEGVGSQSYPTYFFLNKSGKNRDAAFLAASYLTSDDYQRFAARSGMISILKDSAVMREFAADVPYAQGKRMQAMRPNVYAEPTLKTKYNGIANKELLAALEAYHKGADVNTALRDAAERNDKQVSGEQGK